MTPLYVQVQFGSVDGLGPVVGSGGPLEIQVPENTAVGTPIQAIREGARNIHTGVPGRGDNIRVTMANKKRIFMDWKKVPYENVYKFPEIMPSLS